MIEVKSPVTGIVVEIQKQAGDSCNAGQCLLILESMKMQFNVDAPCTCVVERVLVKAGDTVEEGELLVRVRNA